MLSSGFISLQAGRTCARAPGTRLLSLLRLRAVDSADTPSAATFGQVVDVQSVLPQVDLGVGPGHQGQGPALGTHRL